MPVVAELITSPLAASADASETTTFFSCYDAIAARLYQDASRPVEEPIFALTSTAALTLNVSPTEPDVGVGYAIFEGCEGRHSPSAAR